MAKRIRTSAPESRVAAAAKEAVSAIAEAAKEAAAVVLKSAQGAARALDASKPSIGENWDDYKKLVMSELNRLNLTLEKGLKEMSDTFVRHNEWDNNQFDLTNKAHEELVKEVATLKEFVKERLNKQYWIILGTVIGTAGALIFAAMYK